VGATKTFKLDELAAAAGVSGRTVRYYVQRGLLPAPQFRGRDTAYDEEHLLRLQAIRRMQLLQIDTISVVARSPYLVLWSRLGDYDPDVLRVLLVVLGVATTAAYAIYTRTQHTNELFGGGHLVFTVPFAAFGVYRFIRIVNRTDRAESPTDSMLHDPAFVVNLILYAAVVVAIVIYAP